VEAALAEARARLARGAVPLAADIGTGSGAIALALAALEPRLPRVYATDRSAEALALAAANARRLGVAERVTFLEGDLLAPLPEPVDLLLANLPYVAPRDAAILPPDVRRYEPELALYGADDGLGHFRRFFAMAPGALRPGAALFLEFGYDQRAALEALARARFPAAGMRVVADYAGWDRLLIVETAPAA
jgi:release factor glutamine methyltransferase